MPRHLPLLIFFASLFLYLFTMSPTINFGDSPELISAAYNLGIAHPPGYPLYSLAGKAFSLLPVPIDIAGRINLLSAFCGALSVFMLALLAAHLGGKNAQFGVLAGALALMMSPLFWSQSVVAEVYTLNLFILLLIVFVLSRLREGEDARLLYAASFICGLGLANHHTLLSLIPVVLLAGFYRGISLARLLRMSGFFILGLSLYIYLPLRSMQNPLPDWGNPEVLKNFFDHILRRQFPTVEGGLDPAAAFSHIKYFSDLLIDNTGLAFIMSALIGLLSFLKRDFVRATVLLFIFLVNGAGTLLFLNPSPENIEDVDVMLIPSISIVALWGGLGIDWLTERKRFFAGPVIAALIVLSLFVPLRERFRQNNHSSDYFALDTSGNILKEIAEGGLLFVESDNSLFPLWYLQQVEGKRNDVAVVDVDFMMLEWYRNEMKSKYPWLNFPAQTLASHAGKNLGQHLLSASMDGYKAAQVKEMIDNLPEGKAVYLSYEFGPVYAEFIRQDPRLLNRGLTYSSGKNFINSPVPVEYELRSVLDPSIPKTEYMKAFSLAYIPSLQERARALLREGKREEATHVIKRIKAIVQEAEKLLKE